jgi:hypothetical protein
MIIGVYTNHVTAGVVLQQMHNKSSNKVNILSYNSVTGLTISQAAVLHIEPNVKTKIPNCTFSSFELYVYLAIS